MGGHRVRFPIPTVTEAGQVALALALETKASPLRLCWEGEEGADDLLLSLAPDKSSQPLDQHASKVVFRSARVER